MYSKTGSQESVLELSHVQQNWFPGVGLRAELCTARLVRSFTEFTYLLRPCGVFCFHRVIFINVALFLYYSVLNLSTPPNSVFDMYLQIYLFLKPT